MFSLGVKLNVIVRFGNGLNPIKVFGFIPSLIFLFAALNVEMT